MDSIELVRPVGTPEEAKKVMEEYQELCNSLLDDGDRQIIQGKVFKKKSAWRKLAKAFNLSTYIVEERSEKVTMDGKDILVFHFKAKAVAPNGCFAEGTGSCDTSEKGLNKTIHNTRTIAETRAVNRAISSLIGSGEVSAEEMPNEHHKEQSFSSPQQKPSWVLGTCKCGGDLKKSINNPDKYYCSNYKIKECKNSGYVADLNKGEVVEEVKSNDPEQY